MFDRRVILKRADDWPWTQSPSTAIILPRCS